jgi:hypothetical protein
MDLYIDEVNGNTIEFITYLDPSVGRYHSWPSDGDEFTEEYDRDSDEYHKRVKMMYDELSRQSLHMIEDTTKIFHIMTDTI